MRGSDGIAGSLFSYVDLEKRVRADHPLRVIRGIVNATLTDLSSEFDALYSPFGRESIPPERLLRALLLQAFYSIRSERQLVERIEFDLLFRWFVGLGVDDPVWDATTFTKNRDRLLAGDVAIKFLAAVLARPKVKKLLSTEHFSVDGTLLEAWASMKSFRPKDGSGSPPDAGRNGEQDFHGQKRSNETHASTTDPDARLYRKGRGKESKLQFHGPRAHGKPQRPDCRRHRHPRLRPRRTARGLASDGTARQPGGEGHCWRATKALTHRTSSRSCGRSTSRRMSHRTSADGAPPLMGARPATRATGSAYVSANGLKRRSAGQRPWRAFVRRATAACPKSTGNSPSSWPHTTWFGCRNCWMPKRDTVTLSKTPRANQIRSTQQVRTLTKIQEAPSRNENATDWRCFSAACYRSVSLKSVCAYCGRGIAATDDSEEHVIPAAIGGRRTVRGLLYGLCNNRAGHTWDAAKRVWKREVIDELRRTRPSQLGFVETRGSSSPRSVHDLGENRGRRQILAAHDV